MTHIQVNGRILKHMGMEFISGQMAIGMKDNGKTVLNMGKDLIILQMANHFTVILLMEKVLAKENTNGQMVKFMLVTF